jgi:hypothetical protein
MWHIDTTVIRLLDGTERAEPLGENGERPVECADSRAR